MGLPDGSPRWRFVKSWLSIGWISWQQDPRIDPRNPRIDPSFGNLGSGLLGSIPGPRIDPSNSSSGQWASRIDPRV